jgi:hypothetical protein
MALSVKWYRVVGKGKDRRYVPIDLGRRGQVPVLSVLFERRIQSMNVPNRRQTRK